MARSLSTKSASKSKRDTGGDRTPVGPLANQTAPTEFTEDSPATKLVTLPLSEIREDAEVQPREAPSPATVHHYAELMQEGVHFPPLDVFGADHLLVDGYQRLAAARVAGIETFEVRVRPGGRREAILFALGANASHGLPLSNSDKRRVVLRMLKDEGWAQWSSNRIAQHCGVSHTLVDTLRIELSSSLATAASETRAFKNKHGTTTKINIKKIGKRKLKPKQVQVEITSKPREPRNLKLAIISDLPTAIYAKPEDAPQLMDGTAELLAAAERQRPVDRRAEHTVMNGEPRHGRGSGSGESTSSADKVAMRTFTHLIVHTVPVDAAKVGKLLCDEWKPEWVIDKIGLIHKWLDQLQAALTTGAAS